HAPPPLFIAVRGRKMTRWNIFPAHSRQGRGAGYSMFRLLAFLGRVRATSGAGEHAGIRTPNEATGLVCHSRGRLPNPGRAQRRMTCATFTRNGRVGRSPPVEAAAFVQVEHHRPVGEAHEFERDELARGGPLDEVGAEAD